MTAESLCTRDVTLRIGAAACLPALARDFGCDPAQALALLGLDEQLFADPDNRVPILKLGKFAADIARMIGRDDLGLLVAKAYGPHALGLTLSLAAEAPDVRTALHTVARFLQYHNAFAFLVLSETEGDAILSYELRDASFEGADIVLVTAIGNALRVMRRFCGEAWCPAEVRFSMAQPESAAPYEAFFQAPVRFESTMDGLVFPRQWLDHRLGSASIDGAAAVLPAPRWQFTDHVRHQIAMRIGFEPVTAASVAAGLGLSRRVLDRRLSGFGTSFRALLDEARFARARRLLSVGCAPLADISLALGYAEPSAFSRAFRSWTGMTPQAWRSLHCDGSDTGQ